MDINEAVQLLESKGFVVNSADGVWQVRYQGQVPPPDAFINQITTEEQVIDFADAVRQISQGLSDLSEWWGNLRKEWDKRRHE